MRVCNLYCTLRWQGVIWLIFVRSLSWQTIVFHEKLSERMFELAATDCSLGPTTKGIGAAITVAVVRTRNESIALAESFALKRSCSTALSFPRNAKDYRLRNVVINRATTPGRCVETGRETIRTRPFGASENRFIRFHFTGEKALCLFWSCRIC